MKAYKGFDKDLKCLGFQYEVGKEYEEQDVILCNKGFHACTVPLDVFRYYAPATSRYCEVEIDGEIEKAVDDSKIAGTKIKIIREISLAELIAAQREYEKREEGAVEKTATAGDCDMATVGYGGAATAGDFGTATAGDYGAATAGYKGAAIAGEHGAAMAGYRGVATVGYKGVAKVENYGTAVSRGLSSAGEYGLCVARGTDCRVKGGLGSVLVIAEEKWDSVKIVHCKTAVVDGEKIKADTWYTLRNGKFSEVEG